LLSGGRVGVVGRTSTEVARGAHADHRHGPPPPRHRDVTHKTPPGRGFSDASGLTPPEDGRAAAPKRAKRTVLPAASAGRLTVRRAVGSPESSLRPCPPGVPPLSTPRPGPPRPA